MEKTTSKSYCYNMNFNKNKVQFRQKPYLSFCGAIQSPAKDTVEITEKANTDNNLLPKIAACVGTIGVAAAAAILGKKKFDLKKTEKVESEILKVAEDASKKIQQESEIIIKNNTIHPITTEPEYDKFLSELNKKKFRQISPMGDIIGNYYQSIIYLAEDGVEVPKKLKALKMYIGNGSWDTKSHCRELYCDINDFLNMYKGEYIPQMEIGKNVVKEKGLANFDSETGEKIVRCIDYSLKELDKEFGVYKGFVYRNGKMSAENAQYLSTSKSMKCLMGDSSEFHVIKTNNGHKISDFQEKYYPVNNNEDEILLSRGGKYKEVTGAQYEEERKKLAQAKYEYLKLTHKDMTFEDVLSRTHVWEEM